jgi:hypothetical protein
MVKRKTIARFGGPCERDDVQAELDRETPDPRLDVPLVGLALLVIVVCLGHLVALHYGRDQGIYAVVADAMVQGKAPYKGAWDFKPPGIFLVYAVARTLFGGGVHAVRVLEALGYGSLVWAFAIFSRRHVGDARPGILGGALAVLTHVQLEFWHTAQPESFAAVLLAWALVAATWEPAERTDKNVKLLWLSWAFVGALYTMASLLKPPLGGGLLVSLGLLLRRETKRVGGFDAKTLAAPIAAVVVGAIVPLALTAAYFASKHALGDLHETLFVFTPYYTKLGFRSEWFLGFVFLAVEQWTFTFSAFNVFGLAFLLALPRLHEKEALGAAHVAGMVAFQLVGVALQAKFFPYHYGASLPFAGLLAGWGFWKLWCWARRFQLAGLVGVGALVWLLHDARTATRDVEDGFWDRCRQRLRTVTDASIRVEVADHLYSVADVDAGENRRVAEWLAARTKPTESVYLYGFEPAIYDLAQRRPATRYIYNVPQRVTWGRENARRVLMDDLRSDPPAVIVVERRDVFPVVTGDNLDSASSLRTFPELANLVNDQYQFAERVGDFELHVRTAR